MKKALLLAAAVSAAVPAWAAPHQGEWSLVFQVPKASYYADFDTMQIRPDDTRLLWVLVDSKAGVNAEGAHSNISLQEYDCERGAFRYLSLASYSGRMGEGELLLLERYSPRESSFTRGSPVKTEAICGHSLAEGRPTSGPSSASQGSSGEE